MDVILDDQDVDRALDMAGAVAVMKRAFLARAAGEMVSPPRSAVRFGDKGPLVFTTGGTSGTGGVAGTRINHGFGTSNASQVTIVWSVEDGTLLGAVRGQRLGDMRTGAIGGVAVDLMAPRNADIAAVIGAGRQARTQLEAAAAVRPLRQVRVYCRDADRRERFAAEMTERLRVPVNAAPTPRTALADAAIVLCATTSETPVIEAEWLAPGAHINTVGPKGAGRHEIGLDVADGASLIATDSPDQVVAYPDGFFLPEVTRLRDLATLVADPGNVKRGSGFSLFCSTGLAGTEVLLAAELFRRIAAI
ncbi:ornithine cyclodeaminase family protein [Sphingomonas sp. MMS24-J13]|uniref:ornithine cyclodeaminase family protein n=1 Tax=Sphingomonas sp. MMS24-J13 TaxID=3238686 RepID=UPI00384F6A20